MARISYKMTLIIAIFVLNAFMNLLPTSAYGISYSTPGFNITFYDDHDNNGSCDPLTLVSCSILYQLITTLSIDAGSAGVFTPYIASDAIPSGADYFSVGFTGYSSPTDTYRGRVAFDDLGFSIDGSPNLLSGKNPGAEDGTNGWISFAGVPDFSFESVTSASFGSLGGPVTLMPQEGNNFFLIGGTSPSSPPGTGFGGFMNTPLIALSGLSGGYSISGYAAIEAVPEPGTVIYFFTGLASILLLRLKTKKHPFRM